MARVVLACWGSHGDVNPYLGLAIALRARGHDAVMAAPSWYREYIERERVGFAPVGPDIDPGDRATVARVMHSRRGPDFLLRDFLFPRIREVHEDLLRATEGADLIVTHPVTFAGPIVAEQQGLPWVSTVLAPLSFFSAHDLPVLPPTAWLHDAVRSRPALSRAVLRIARRITRDWSAPVRALRAELGLGPNGDPIYEGQHSPQCVLALFSPLLGGPQPDWPAHVHVTGHIFYDGGDGGLPHELQCFLDDGPAPVVFTLGTSAVGVAGGFYEESMRAAVATGVRAVLLVGRHADNRPRGALPRGVIAVDWAPHSRLFPRGAAIVHQGGIGTTAQAMRAGKPMLIVPFAHDQPDNAYRTRRLGIARTLSLRAYRASRVARELRALLSDDAMRSAAARVGDRVRAEDGPAAASQAIETLLLAARGPVTRLP
jgi:UDP:flavonoid glycosyltransferase YjiC (YdhE family)